MWNKYLLNHYSTQMAEFKNIERLWHYIYSWYKHTYIHMHLHTYKHTYIHTYTYTHEGRYYFLLITHH